MGLAQTAQLKAQQAEQQLALAYEQQRKLNQLKDQFILHVSHELRTPLTEVYGFLELLSDYHGQLDAATQATFLSNAKSGCQELMRMVGDVLSATQASSEVTPPQRAVCSVAQAVRDVLHHLDPREAQAYALRLEISEDVSLYPWSRSLEGLGYREGNTPFSPQTVHFFRPVMPKYSQACP